MGTGVYSMSVTHKKRSFIFPAFLSCALLPFLLLGCAGKERKPAAVEKETIATEFGDLTLVLVPSTGDGQNGAGCLTADRLVSYELWAAVKTWAENPARGDRAYSFAHEGRRYGAYTIDGMPGDMRFEPVTDINWRDAVIWLNAFTEWINEHAIPDAGAESRLPVEPVYYADERFTGPIRQAADFTVADGPFVKPGAAGFRLPRTDAWEEALRVEIPAYDEQGNPKRRWLFPDIDGPNSEWCFDIDPFEEEIKRSWRGGGATLRKVPCSCAASPPIRSMPPERTSVILGFRFCKTVD